MAFVMTHLAVAKEVNDSVRIVKNFPEYYLGTISPDCVHVRKNYNSDMKRLAHFCVGDEGWGRITYFSLSDNLAFIKNTAKEIVQLLQNEL